MCINDCNINICQILYKIHKLNAMGTLERVRKYINIKATFKGYLMFKQSLKLGRHRWEKMQKAKNKNFTSKSTEMAKFYQVYPRNETGRKIR